MISATEARVILEKFEEDERQKELKNYNIFKNKIQTFIDTFFVNYVSSLIIKCRRTYVSLPTKFAFKTTKDFHYGIFEKLVKDLNTLDLFKLRFDNDYDQVEDEIYLELVNEEKAKETIEQYGYKVEIGTYFKISF